PSQQAMRATLYALRDSLLLVDAARARIARDLGGASDAALRSRARVMSERCQAASHSAVAARDSVSASELPVRDSLRARESLVRALERLGADLDHCATEFEGLSRPEQAEELRGYGIGKGERVSQSIRRYQPAVQNYFEVALGTRYMPSLRGAGSIPSSTGP
ncbi:MAG TPA: hypothetical protein VNH46_04790, partial [Gemmatimonadales bacterium]|nr:hypothetical protein [Gemmatimonadales bacterium]